MSPAACRLRSCLPLQKMMTRALPSATNSSVDRLAHSESRVSSSGEAIDDS